MNKLFLGIVSCITCITGVLICCIMQGWIIIQIPNHSTATVFQGKKENKPIKLYMWRNHRWHTETDSLVWSVQLSETIKTMLTRWLDLLHEEQYLPLNIALQSVLLSSDTTIAYISFTTSPFNTDSSTFEHIMFIKSIMRTLRDNAIPIQAIMLLENHKPIEHTHLDFSQPWPLHCLNDVRANH